MTNGADILVECLARWGVRRIYGMPGSHSTAIYDALARAGTIRTYLFRNEQAAAFAADGAARVTGEPGVVCTTAGPGATNALTGLAECWADSIPALLVAGQVNVDAVDRECGNYHEIDLEGIFRPVTKWCGTLRRLDRLPSMVGHAFQAMTWGRPRPSALFLPQDLMRAPCPADLLIPAFPPPPTPAVPAVEIARAARILAESRRPILLAGGGALWSGAAGSIAALARRLGAPVITTLNAKGLIDERDPLSLGHARSARARAALPHADAMLAIGCRFTEVLTDWRRMIVPDRLIQVDLDADQIGMNYPALCGIVADADAACRAILEALTADRGPESSEWQPAWDTARSARHPRPEWLIETLRQTLPDEVPVFTDACEIGFRMQADWPSYVPRAFFYPSNYITLGWAFPAAVGAAAALNRPVVSVSGDGGFVMCAQELATAARYGLRVIAIVHNDSTLGAIKNIQDRAYQGRYLDTELNNPDFPRLAESFGVVGRRASTPEEVASAVREAIDRDGPTLIEVPDRWRFLRDLANPVQKSPSAD